MCISFKNHVLNKLFLNIIIWYILSFTNLGSHCSSSSNDMDRPKSTASTFTHTTETASVKPRSEPATPAHKTWTAFQGPVLFTGRLSCPRAPN